MNEIRSFASLSGSLLARKGGAKPAMRPRPIASNSTLDDLGWDDMGYAAEDPVEHVPSSIAALTPAPRSAAARDEQPQVHLQQRALADRYSEPAPVKAPPPQQPFVAAPVQAVAPAPVEPFAPASVEAVAPAPAPAPSPAPVEPAAKVPAVAKRSAVAQGRKAAFTLRLDTARHLRLRLATAVTGQSAQQLVTGALDRFLETLPEVGTMAEHVPVRSTSRS